LRASAAFTSADRIPLLKAFGNGMADVFPQDSLQDRCRLNISNTYTTTDTLLARGSYTFATDKAVLFNDIANLMTYPYGLMFNCLYSVNNLFFSEDPVGDTSFASKLIFINQPITNVVFNAGYLYTDVTNYLNLDAADEEYWTKAGGYLGDFTIRFFWRTPFSQVF